MVADDDGILCIIVAELLSQNYCHFLRLITTYKVCYF